MSVNPLRALALPLLMIALLTPRGAQAADLFATLQRLRVADCGIPGASRLRWRANAQLSEAAAKWSGGDDLRHAVESSGYVPTALGALHADVVGSSRQPRLDHAGCEVLRNPQLRDAGIFSRGSESWIVFAAPADLPADEDFATTLERAAMQVNRVRQRGRRCGQRFFPPAHPVRLSALLSDAAAGHASDMATRDYFDHRDPSGRSPADRVRAAGYRERLVGENIAFGPLSTQDAIDGWVKSAAHCENIMDPRFTEMGIGFARRNGERPGVYWVQLFAESSVPH